MKISFQFLWYDAWIGVFFDRKEKTWYICPLPCCVIKIEPKKMASYAVPPKTHNLRDFLENMDQKND